MAELTDAQKVLRNDTGKRIAAAIEALGGTPPIDLGMTGASVGQVPVINTVDANGAPTSYRPGAGGGASMTILSYGISTWNDFITAYNSNNIVYCRASSAADPSSGSQTRLAFMAYVNNASSPTSVEFQYYRSVSGHTDSQQGDQVFIYRLTSAGVWSVETRNTFTKIAAGANITSSYTNGTLTLSATGGGGGTTDYDDLTDKPSINGTTLSGNKTAAELGLGTYSKPSGGIPKSDLASAVLSPYRTAAAQDAIDAAQDAEIGIVVTGKRPSIAVTAGQYVIVRNSTISGIADGLYTANTTLSPSTDVTAANLTAVSNGGLNDLKAKQPRLENTVGSSTTIPALTSQVIRLPVASVPGYKASGVMGVVGTGNCVIAVFLVDYINQEVVCRLYNPTDTASTFTPIFVCLYLAE